MQAILDSTVVIHLLRRYKPALVWFDNNIVYGITAITWMEVMQGTTNKMNQAHTKTVLSQFAMAHLTVTDQEWAMIQLERFQFSHHVGMNDCLIASVAHRLDLPLYTHNLRDMSPLVGDLAMKPYI